MSIDFKFDNTKLLESLKQFPQNIQNNILVGAVRAGAKPLVNAAKANVPVDTANLKRSIGINRKKTKDKSQVWFTVSPRKGGKNDGFYGHMVEFGTSKMAAQPFMRPAFESQDKQSIEAVKEYMALRIDKEVEKARK
ncbi:HK97-gp10 family putative phage morphogenesis protein [Aliarcobacter butzleri]|uniref:HK97-gp10 family putative phage morphogenesis protein n=1 Tax=Aliarcobacter butzleri TaxID=28197 RepID=UPI00125F1113|nr:HK97-gp10 family putative phage morphogenesis protein [Aliarcobacter butzleri]MDS1371032.1 HK97 gp10 family phage protein [Aliarcobacter butzleri]UXC28572.1 HK97 gp10 family phage protein [Aliarcobacter butzleri]UXC29229.1 HK97 gp10 family phage protein [Aliarcobacter butzleri]